MKSLDFDRHAWAAITRVAESCAGRLVSYDQRGENVSTRCRSYTHSSYNHVVNRVTMEHRSSMESAVDLGSRLWWGKPTVLCL